MNRILTFSNTIKMSGKYPLVEPGSEGLMLTAEVVKTRCCDCGVYYKNCLKLTDSKEHYLHICKKCLVDFFCDESDDEYESEESE